MTDWLNQVHVGNCMALMRRMIADGVKVQCIVTSPPYWGLRDYGVPGQFGSERTWLRHCARLRSVFRLCRELLADDGVLWLNYGDSYASSGGTGSQGKHGDRNLRTHTQRALLHAGGRNGLKAKDLIGMPWRVAFTLQADGWYLRQDVIWAKPNPMPESVRDRCTKAHEYMFLFSKRERYYWDFAAMQEDVTGTANPRRAGDKTPDGWDTRTGEGGHGSFHSEGREKGHRPAVMNVRIAIPELGNKTHAGADLYAAGDERHRTKVGLVDYATKLRERAKGYAPPGQHQHSAGRFGTAAEVRKLALADSGTKNNESMDEALHELVLTRNKRSVWTVASEPFKEAHFATFPRSLIEPCILAGSRAGDTVFDPFMGSGTTAEVASDLGRNFIGCELNPAYAAMYKAARSQQVGFAL